MFAVVDPSGCKQNEPEPASSARFDSRLELATGDILFRRGDPRTCAFHIVTGAVLVFRANPEGGREIIEVAHADELVGLGLLEHHVFTAEAIAPTSVIALPLEAVERLVASDLRIAERRNDLVDREVAALRDALVAEGRRDRTRRVAALLLVLAQGALREGRDPTLVGDEFASGPVADYLGLDVDALQAALVTLEARGLVAIEPKDAETAAPCRLRLTDLDRLQAFVDG
jgi:CRP/FNR family transcriptional regulator, anaerobic regulatory protein